MQTKTGLLTLTEALLALLSLLALAEVLLALLALLWLIDIEPLPALPSLLLAKALAHLLRPRPVAALLLAELAARALSPVLALLERVLHIASLTQLLQRLVSRLSELIDGLKIIVGDLHSERPNLRCRPIQQHIRSKVHALSLLRLVGDVTVDASQHRHGHLIVVVLISLQSAVELLAILRHLRLIDTLELKVQHSLLDLLHLVQLLQHLVGRLAELGGGLKLVVADLLGKLLQLLGRDTQRPLRLITNDLIRLLTNLLGRLHNDLGRSVVKVVVVGPQTLLELRANLLGLHDPSGPLSLTLALATTKTLLTELLLALAILLLVVLLLALLAVLLPVLLAGLAGLLLSDGRSRKTQAGNRREHTCCSSNFHDAVLSSDEV